MAKPAGELVWGLPWAKFHHQLFLFLAYATSQSNQVYKCPYHLLCLGPGQKGAAKKPCARPCTGKFAALGWQMPGSLVPQVTSWATALSSLGIPP